MPRFAAGYGLFYGYDEDSGEVLNELHAWSGFKIK